MATLALSVSGITWQWRRAENRATEAQKEVVRPIEKVVNKEGGSTAGTWDNRVISEEDPEDCRTVSEKARAAHYATVLRSRKAAAGSPVKVVKTSEEEERVAAQLEKLKAAQKKARGVQVDLE